MKKRMITFAAGGLAFLVLLTGAGYYGLAAYYKNVFSLNTWINGVYCTGRTVDEVNQELLRQTVLPDVITVTGYDTTGGECVTKDWTLHFQDIEFKADYSDMLEKCLRAQGNDWTGHFTQRDGKELKPDLSYNVERLQGLWDQIISAAQQDADYRIEYSETEGYSLYDGLHYCLDEEKAHSLLLDAVIEGKTRLDLVESGCYYDPKPTKEQKEAGRLWEQIEAYQNNGPEYDFDSESFQIDKAVMADFLVKEEGSFLPALDESGNLQPDADKADSYIEQLAEAKDTYKKEWDFKATCGDIVKVKGVTYGSTLDQTKEKKWLGSYLQYICSGKATSEDLTMPHDPKYTREAYSRCGDTVGDTYVEVDMGHQKIYYYEKGELRFESDVVTGNMARGMSTPEGVNFVYAKQKNRVLRGPNYASPVKYWMPVKGAIGIHDANWRDSFGGEIYKTSGSHGCVNVPPKVMGDLYDMVEIGTPVVMFYG